MTTDAFIIQATIAAQQAAKTSCASFVNSFKGSVDVQIQKHYAECVELLYPATYSPETIIFLKILAGAAVVGFLAGIIALYREGISDIGDWIMTPLTYTVGALVPVGFLYVVLNAILFIFS